MGLVAARNHRDGITVVEEQSWWKSNHGGSRAVNTVHTVHTVPTVPTVHIVGKVGKAAYRTVRCQCPHVNIYMSMSICQCQHSSPVSSLQGKPWGQISDHVSLSFDLCPVLYLERLYDCIAARRQHDVPGTSQELEHGLSMILLTSLPLNPDAAADAKHYQSSSPSVRTKRRRYLQHST